MKLFIRLFARCDDLAQAKLLSERFVRVLSPTNVLPFTDPKPYWKVEGWYEFSLVAHNVERTEFERILATCPAGWVHQSDEHESSSVWNKSGDNVFLDASVQWAEVQIEHNA